MTFYVDFFADQAFLSFVKSSLGQLPQDPATTRFEDAAVAVLACAAALEALANRLFLETGALRHYDSLRLTQKIETLADFAAVEIEWGRAPWQDVAALIRARNWLAHYKESGIGLVNSEGRYVRNHRGIAARQTPETVLARPAVERYYHGVLDGMYGLAKGLGKALDFEYLDTEQYEPYVAG